MLRTTRFPLLLALISACSLCETDQAHGEQYTATDSSLAKHTAPSWYRDAKLGIFVHWGLYSVPGWAPIQGPHDGDFSNQQWMTLNPYAEWYYNTVRIEGSPTQAYHRDHYGAGFNYYQFAESFNRETAKWDPNEWATLFKQTGARYVVLTTKHHDGFTLWPTAVPNPHLPAGEAHAQRDIVGDLTKAVRQQGLKMGFYYSGGFDWSFVPGPFHSQSEASAGTPQSDEYARYADAQYRELMHRYAPDILWNDIRYPAKGEVRQIFAEFYNRNPQGVVNDRWSPFSHSDVTTPEYKTLSTIASKPWEECRGLGQSFGYNRAEGEDQTISADALIKLLVDVVSKNGNLLLDVGPEADGTVPAIQVDRLHALGGWLTRNGEAIFDTRPWDRAEGLTTDGIPVRFTSKDGEVFAVLLGRPAGNTVTLKDVTLPVDSASILGDGSTLHARQLGNDLQVSLPPTLPGQYAWVIRLRYGKSAAAGGQRAGSAGASRDHTDRRLQITG